MSVQSAEDLQRLRGSQTVPETDGSKLYYVRKSDIYVGIKVRNKS